MDTAQDMLTKGLKLTDHPLVSFFDEVKAWIQHGEKGIASQAPMMSHHLFDHLLMGTEMCVSEDHCSPFIRTRSLLSVHSNGRLSLSVCLSVCLSVSLSLSLSLSLVAGCTV